MSNWSSQFEKYPAGSDFGSVSCYALKDLKDEFYSRLTVEHEITEGATPIVTHKAGECTVCLVTNETPVTTFTVGGIQYNTDNNALYRDTGSIMNAVAGKDHGALINLLAEDAHTQYIVINKSGGVETFTTLTVPSIIGLDTSEADYTADNFVMPQVLHLGTDPSGGAKHDDGTFVTSFHFGTDHINLIEDTIFDGALTANTPTGNIVMADYSFLPYGSGADYFSAKILPAFLEDLETAPDDYGGAFSLYPNADVAEAILKASHIGA